MRRPGCFPRAWSSWHLQVARLQLLFGPSVPLHSSSWASVAGGSACYPKRLLYLTKKTLLKLSHAYLRQMMYR